MANISPEEFLAYRKSLAAVRSKAVKVPPVPLDAPSVPVEVAPLVAPVVPSDPRPGSYEDFLAENVARLRLPGMVRGLGGCAVEATSVNPFTGKPHSEDPPPGPVLKDPTDTSYACEPNKTRKKFEDYYDELQTEQSQTP